MTSDIFQLIQASTEMLNTAKDLNGGELPQYMTEFAKKADKLSPKFLHVKVEPRYWEDSDVNGQSDVDRMMPCGNRHTWEPVIDIETGVIVFWPKGTTAQIHYKVCDAGLYELVTRNGTVLGFVDGYVISSVCPNGNGYGDYIKMNIDADGKIENWKFNIEDFMESDDN